MTIEKRSVLYTMILPIYIGIRIVMVNRLMMADCDEVFNYWEVVHFLLYGNGLQTWEYAHEFALRTYTYLLPVTFIAQWLPSNFPVEILTGFPIVSSNPKIATFVMLRSILAGISACGEVYWLISLTDEPTLIVSFFLALFMLPSAYLPSATWMTVWCVAAACLQRRRYHMFVNVCVVATLCTGWPFGAVCVVPMAVEVLRCIYIQQKLVSFALYIIGVTVVVQLAVMVIDHVHYGEWVSATWNIFEYNARNSNDELYGVEPVSYYIKNIVLNLNYTAILGFFALPLYLVSGGRSSTVLSILASLWPWVVITFPRPHKEERFLYPIYPVLIYGSVLVVDRLVCSLATSTDVLKGATKSKTVRFLLLLLLFVPSIMVSMSRFTGISRYYSAPLQIYSQIPENSTVCACGEWYRFPGSFYANLLFLPSSFRGQLPQPFSLHGSRTESMDVLQPFNDKNKHQSERYSDVSDCDYIVDLANGDCPKGEIVASARFLDAGRTSTLHRTLYIPYLHEMLVTQNDAKVRYLDYVLMRSKRLDKVGSSADGRSK